MIEDSIADKLNEKQHFFDPPGQFYQLPAKGLI